MVLVLRFLIFCLTRTFLLLSAFTHLVRSSAFIAGIVLVAVIVVFLAFFLGVLATFFFTT